MDTLIRSAQVAPLRTRLSETRAAGADAASAAQQSAQAQLDALRSEIEKQVRSEWASQMQKLYDSERERAHADGYADGMAEANAAAAKELEQARGELQTKVNSALSAMEQAHWAALVKLESSVGEVAFAAVCRLVSWLATSQEFVLGLVEHTCDQLRADVSATVRLHPRDIETLRGLMHDQELRVNSLGLKVVPDESLQLGGCVIEAASGQYDGGLETQLRRLHAVLAGTPATEHSSDKPPAVDKATERLRVVKG